MEILWKNFSGFVEKKRIRLKRILKSFTGFENRANRAKIRVHFRIPSCRIMVKSVVLQTFYLVSYFRRHENGSLVLRKMYSEIYIFWKCTTI